MRPTDDEIRSGWMTTRDAELFGVLARTLTAVERRQVAEASPGPTTKRISTYAEAEDTTRPPESRLSEAAGPVGPLPRIPSRRGPSRDRAVDPAG